MTTLIKPVIKLPPRSKSCTTTTSQSSSSFYAVGHSGPDSQQPYQSLIASKDLYFEDNENTKVSDYDMQRLFSEYKLCK